MLYEKPRKKRKEILFDTLLYGAIAIVIFVYFLYGFVSITEMVGESAKVTDVINSVAQIATACAFLLAFTNTERTVSKTAKLKLLWKQKN